MIWDDHECEDGWGSYFLDRSDKDEMKDIFPKLDEKGLTWDDGLELRRRMFAAATQVYREYQHSHNPPTPMGQYDYSFSLGDTSAFYILDGRGYRDINRSSFRILGEPQFKRFSDWLEGEEIKKRKFLFIVAAVPLLHMYPVLVNSDETFIAKLDGLGDDLRDSWEHALHNIERQAVFEVLFKAADRGQRVVILSGDVHIAAAFRITKGKSSIFQLTSSAITYNVPTTLGWLLGKGVPDDGITHEGYQFKRMGLYTDSNFSLIQVDPGNGSVEFQLYGPQTVKLPEELHQALKKDGYAESRVVTHSIAKLPLIFT
jgi:alkaline phosphatase D